MRMARSLLSHLSAETSTSYWMRPRAQTARNSPRRDDLCSPAEFPDMKGFSGRNLRYMRTFAAAWPEEPFGQQPLPNLPWFHICLVLDKVSDAKERQFYI